MSLRLRRIAVDGFRKFREPMVIEGLTEGLNIVIEPNETCGSAPKRHPASARRNNLR